MANTQMPFLIARLAERSGIRRITEPDGGEFSLGRACLVPNEVVSILAAGHRARVMVSVNFCNDVVRIWDVRAVHAPMCTATGPLNESHVCSR